MARATTITSSTPPADEEPLDETLDDTLQDGDVDGMDWETRARAMGWKPEAQYRGPPGRWLPAKEFVLKGENELPVLRDQLRRLQARMARADTSAAEMATLRQQLSETQQTLQEMRGLVKGSYERGRAAERQALEAAQDEAAANGNTQEVRRIRQELREMDAEEKPPAANPNAPPPPPPKSPEVLAFEAQNPWIGKDPYLTKQIITAHELVMKRHPGMNLASQLQLAKQKVVKDNPEMFADELGGMTDEEVAAARAAARGQRPPDDEVDEVYDEEVELEDEPAPPPPPRRPAARPAATVTRPRVSALPGRQRQQVDPFTIASIEDAGERAEARRTFDRWKRNIPDLTEREYMTTYRDPKADILATQEAIKKGTRK